MEMELPKIFPVPLVNQPLEKLDQDAFYMNVQVKELEKAVDDGANFIGIFSEYGGGKSSIVRNFVKSEEKYQFCNICLWNYEGEKKQDTAGGLTPFTHSFLYQLSKILKRNSFTRHINRMLSKNYKQLSFSTDICRWKKGLLVFLLILLIGGKVFSTKTEFSEEIPFLGNRVTALQNFAAKIYDGNIVIGTSALILILLLFANNNVMFSWQDDGINRELTDVDSYEVFEKIIEEAKKAQRFKKHKYILNIEDLDRIEERQEILEFLKALYRFNTLLSNEDRRKFIFIISLSIKSYFEMREKDLFEKLFDYAIVLRPINRERIEDLFFNLLKEKRSDILSNLESKQIPGKEWFTKGDNLEIRIIKSRINIALEIHDNLSMEEKISNTYNYVQKQEERSGNEKDEKSKSTKIDFAKCAIIAYLESAYPMDMYYFTDYSMVWENAFQFLKDNERIQFHNILDGQTILSKAFRDEIKDIFKKNMGYDDYWTYFHRNPKKYSEQKNK